MCPPAPLSPASPAASRRAARRPCCAAARASSRRRRAALLWLGVLAAHPLAVGVKGRLKVQRGGQHAAALGGDGPRALAQPRGGDLGHAGGAVHVARDDGGADRVAVRRRADDAERLAVTKQDLAAVEGGRAAVRPAWLVEHQGDEPPLQPRRPLGAQRVAAEEGLRAGTWATAR
eukprot:7131068-Prymnesium_polylepis.1